MSTTEVEKKMDQIRKEFQKKNLVISREKKGNSQVVNAGKSISAYEPDNWLFSFMTFLVNSLPSSGTDKKILLKLMSENFSVEIWDEIEPLFESFLEELNSPVGGHLTVAALNEEVQNLKNAGKVAISDKDNNATDEQKKLQRFLNFFSLFTAKLAELGINDDESIAKFLIQLVHAVPKISIKRNSPDGSKINGK